MPGHSRNRQRSPKSDRNSPRYDGTITIADGGSTITSAGTCGSGTSTDAWNAGTNGKFNASIGFDGTNDYASFSGTIITVGSQLPYTTVSWGGWFYPTTGVASETLLEKTVNLL